MNYPLIQHAHATLQAASGMPLSAITVEALAAGNLTANDLQVSGETLRQQAEIARNAGYSQLAENLTRAAELTAVPNEELLKMYDLLRPGRSHYAEMVGLADRLDQHYQATETARFVREAAEVYQQRGLLKRE